MTLGGKFLLSVAVGHPLKTLWPLYPFVLQNTVQSHRLRGTYEDQPGGGKFGFPSSKNHSWAGRVDSLHLKLTLVQDLTWHFCGTGEFFRYKQEKAFSKQK
jgi:hypothetical protein